MIYVKLLKDIVGYGRQGSVIPIAPGRMRNLLYPRQKAAYLTKAELHEVGNQDVVPERDSNFGRELPDEDHTSKPPTNNAEGLVDVQAQLLSPERVTQILSANLPASLVFYRSPIPRPAPETPPPPRQFPQQYMSTAEMNAALAPAPIDSQPIGIYGSVSNADIAESIKALLAETEEGARVVIGTDDVKIVRNEGEQDAEADRLKALGEYRVEIQVKGGEPVTRTVRIEAQEGETPTTSNGQKLETKHS